MISESKAWNWCLGAVGIAGGQGGLLVQYPGPLCVFPCVHVQIGSEGHGLGEQDTERPGPDLRARKAASCCLGHLGELPPYAPPGEIVGGESPPVFVSVCCVSEPQFPDLKNGCKTRYFSNACETYVRGSVREVPGTCLARHLGSRGHGGQLDRCWQLAGRPEV